MSHGAGRVNYISCGFDPGHYEALWLHEIGGFDNSRLREFLNMRDLSTTQSLKRLVREVLREDFGSGLACECLAELALVSALRHLCASQRGSQHGALAGWQLRKVNERIRDCLEGPVSLAELAALCHISPRHLMRGFLTATGHTLGAVMREVQTDRAKKLLRGTDLSTAEIASRIGFSNASNFASAFRRAEGLSPSEYRRGI
jgi:AraC family transcriptional regulator